VRRVNERWVCKRCFADNEATDASCTKCGLARGAEVAESDQAAWAAPGTATPERPAWMGLLRFWWVGVILVVLAVGWFTAARRGDDGSLTSAGTVDVTELRVGDCFSGAEETQISEVDGVPCAEPHDYEIFAVSEQPGDSYPTDAEFDAIFGSLCVPAFESYVGAPYASSELYAGMITPSESSWGDGDRDYLCYLYEPTDASLAENVALTGSMRGAAR
jgi:hypothetical protein